MKKTMSKKIVAIMVCTAALAGIYGGPVYAESLYKGNLSDIVYVKGGSTGFPRITDLDLDKVTIDGTNGSITINGQKIQTDNMNNIYVNTGLHTTGQITVDDNLSVSRNATVKGTLAVGTDGGQFIVGENGAISADGGDLDKEQRTAEKMMTALEGDAATSYATFAPALSAELSKTMDQKNFTAIQRQVKQQFGSLKETKFFSFERYDQADKVTYIAGFSKEKIVVMSFVFGKDAKLQNFSFSPYKAPEQAPAEKK